MKYSIVLALALAGAGCAHQAPAPGFHQTYLPVANSLAPQKRIDLPKEVIEKAKGSWLSRSYLPVSLWWIEDDRLLLNIHERGSYEKLLHSFAIVPSTNEVRLLRPEEKEGVAGARNKMSRVISPDKSGAGTVAEAIVGLGMVIVSGGRAAPSGGGLADQALEQGRYAGTLEDKGTVLTFDIVSEKRKHWGPFGSHYFRVKYSAKNERTGESLEAERVVEEDEFLAEHGLQGWLGSWRVSPDGRYYLIGKSATLVDPKAGSFTTLIEDYRPSYIECDASPRWDRIALLKMEQDGKTNEPRYRLEFFPLRVQ